MNRSVSCEVCNRNLKYFEDFVASIYRTVLNIGCKILSQALEQMDGALMEQRNDWNNEIPETRLSGVVYQARLAA